MLAKQAALKRERNKQFFRHENQENDVSDLNLGATETDPNAEILQPMTDLERLERKRKLQEQLFLENEKGAKLSRAKKKRFDKYIEHQLKREEKKVLLEKLSHTKVDTSLYARSKLLGTGKQSRKEEMIEALELERQGRASDRTRDILYEEREEKDMDLMNEIDDHNESESSEASNLDNDDADKFGDFGPATETSASTFIDSRPAKFGGTGTGFGFANLKVKEKAQPVKKYTWRKKLELERLKRAKKEEEDDFVESSEGDQDEDVGEGENGDYSSEEISGEDEEGASGEGNEVDDEEMENEASESASSDSESGSEEGSDSESESGSEELPRLLQNKPQHSATAASFKEWAEEQVKTLEGRHEIPLLPEVSERVKESFAKPRVREEDIDHSSDEEGYIPINKKLQRDAFFVTVDRPDSVQQLRMQLPVFNEEHRIMEAITHHDCVVICGETGSGKTTQVPQFLYEAGFGNHKSPHKGMIGITQPRRVAAIAMANRLGDELGDHGRRVGYQIRFDSTIANEGQPDGTAIKFMTDGVLLREIQADFMLSKYSAIVVDEAHERNINTDILIGLLSRLLKLRRQYHQKEPNKYSPLKLIIMSATLRVSDFSENTNLFKTPPPIIKVDARQYSVSVHFNKRTPYEYLDDAFNKACKIHRKLPPGGILIFLTSQAEITSTVKRLRQEFPLRNTEHRALPKIKLSKEADAEAEEIDFSVGFKEEGAEEVDDYNSDSEEEGFEEEREAHQTDNDPLYVLPLYSLLPSSEQMKVFEEPPAGARMCIVATNVAETSLTIPGIRYVVDCGRSKERKYNDETGVQSFEVDWISKASADQRAGRAGRTGPGHCYRLFSSAVYEDFFLQFSKPEILRMPVESVVLNMKSMGIDKVVNFPFPTPPGRVALKNAERLLSILGAIDRTTKSVTATGKSMSLFPLSPRFAKILLVGDQAKCLPYIVALVSAFSVGDPFIGEHEVASGSANAAKESALSQVRKAKAQFGQLDLSSDALTLLAAVCAVDHIEPSKRKDFYESHFLRQKVMEEIAKLRHQVYHIVKTRTRVDSIAEQDTGKEKLPIPSRGQIAAIKQMIAAGFLDQVSIRGDLVDSDIKLTNKMSVSSIPYSAVLPTTKYGDEVEKGVYIHPGSILATSGQQPPPYLVFQSLNLSLNNIDGKMQKLRMKPLVDISPNQLSNLAKNTPLITYSKPLGHPYAPKNLTPTKRECYVVPRFGASMEESGIGWDLPVIKVIQVRENGSWTMQPA